jgi:acid phosphatase
MTDRSLSRRRALQLVGAAAFAPFSRAWATSPEPALTFLAVGDWGRDGAFHQSDVAGRMGETAAAVKARFVVSVGDNFYEAGVSGVDDPKWKSSFSDIYAAPALQVPWYAALGNHDYYGDPEAQVAYTKADPLKRWRMPKRWHSFVDAVPGVSTEVFVLDTTPLIADYYARHDVAPKLASQDPAAQLAWFDAALAASKADWKIVVGHHPIYSGDNSRHGPEGHWGSPDLVAKLDPILQRRGVALYLYGHDHELQHTLRKGIHYVCTGAGSKTEHDCDQEGSDLCSLESGFVACGVTRREIKVAYRDWKGEELRVVDISRPGSQG